MTGGAECAKAEETLVDAARTMARLNVGALPICGADNRLKGMLTDRDIVVKVVAEGRDPQTVTVAELAQGKPVTIGADDPVDEALRTMADHRVRRLPVIDGHELIGVLSQADIAINLDADRAGSWSARSRSATDRVAAPLTRQDEQRPVLDGARVGRQGLEP